MPEKKTRLTDAERAKRIRETAREIGTSDDPKDFEKAFGAISRTKAPPTRTDNKPSRVKG